MKKGFKLLLLVMLLMGVLLSNTAVAKDYTVAGILMNAEHEWFRTVEMGMRAAAVDYDVNLVIGSAEGRVDQEANLVDTYVAQSMDAICISAISTDASVPALERAVSEGVKLINYNTNINSGAMTTFVGVDNYELGAQMGRYLIDWLDEKNLNELNVALITIPMYEIGNMRRDGFVEAIEDDPRINIVAEQAGEVPENAASTVESVLEAHPETNVVWAANEGGALGSMIGVASSGKAEQVKVFGTDMSIQLARALVNEQGIVEAISTQQPYEIGYKSVEAAVKKIEGEELSENIIVPLELYTRDDPEAVNEYLEKYEYLAN